MIHRSKVNPFPEKTIRPMSQNRFSLLLLSGCLSAALGLSGACQHGSGLEADAIRHVHVASQGAVSSHGMVVSGNRLSSEAGVEMLRAGGNAVDAAVATAFAIGVVDTGNAGLGGGGGMLVWLERDKRAEFADFYSRAGSARGDEGSARNVAIPGHAAGLIEAHARYGRLPRETVLAPAIRLAREGFAVPVNLSSSLASHQEKNMGNAGPEAVELFYPGGEPLQPGDWLVQEAKATVLERIASDGAAGFYAGPVAEQLVKDLNAAGNPAILEDFSGFQARWMRPLAGGFRNYTVLSAPPPLGGTQVIQPLVMLDRFSLREHGLPAFSPVAAAKIVDAFRMANRDYSRWIHDPDTPVPAAGLVSPAYARHRQELIGASPVPSSMPSGNPWDFEARVDDRFHHLRPWPPSDRIGGAGPETGDADELSEEDTTHLSVIDAEGNAVAITMTLGPSFGAGFYSQGIFFNNGITRFGTSPEGNRWAPGRTPRSNTSPTIVLENDRVRLVTGAQGGQRIPGAVVFNILYALEYGLSASEAMAGPRMHPFFTQARLHVEASIDHSTLADSRRRGFEIVPYGQQDSYFAGAHMIVVRPDGRLHGAADLRRAGTAVGY